MTIRNANRNINKLYHVVTNSFTKPINRNTTSNIVNVTTEPATINTTVYEPQYNNWFKKIINYFKYQYPNQFNSIDNKLDVTIISLNDSRKDKKLISSIDSKGGSTTVNEADSALHNDIESKLESELNIEDKISLLNDILNDFYIKTSKIQNHLDSLSSINMTLVNDVNDLNVLIQWNEKAMELSKFSLLDINSITRIDSRSNNNVENNIDSQLDENINDIRNNSIDSRIDLLINSTNSNRLVSIINTTLPYKLMDMLDRCIVSTNILSQAIDPNYSNNPTTISSHSNWFKYSSSYLDNTLVSQFDSKVYIRITNTTNKNIKQIIDVLDTTNIHEGKIYLTNFLQLHNQPFNHTIHWTFKDVDRKDDRLLEYKVASNIGSELVSKVKVIVSLNSSNNNRYLRNLINKCVKLSQNKLINYNKLSDRSMHIYSDDELELLRNLGISNQYNQLYNHKQSTSNNNNILQFKSIYHTNYHSNYYIISNIKYFTSNLMNYYNSNHLNIKSKHKLNILKFLSFTLWLRVSSIIGLIYVSLEAAKEPEDIINKLNYIKGNMKDFIDRRLVIPSKSILNDVILNKRVSITDKEALEDAKKSLSNMIYDFLVQHKLSMSDNEKKKVAKAMDMSLISSEYEKELKRPIQNIVSGRIARIVLIQLQFVKKELLVAMEAIDELFNANQVNLQLLAVMPAIFSLIVVQSFGKFLINFIRSSSRGKFIESATSIHREIRYELRELERLLSITNTLDQNHLIYGQMISKLYYIHNLLVSNSQLFEYEILQLLHEDFRDLLINTLTIEQRLHIIYRINRSYLFLQNYKRGLQMWPVG